MKQYLLAVTTFCTAFGASADFYSQTLEQRVDENSAVLYRVYHDSFTDKPATYSLDFVYGIGMDGQNFNEISPEQEIGRLTFICNSHSDTSFYAVAQNSSLYQYDYETYPHADSVDMVATPRVRMGDGDTLFMTSQPMERGYLTLDYEELSEHLFKQHRRDSELLAMQDMNRPSSHNTVRVPVDVKMLRDFDKNCRSMTPNAL